MIIINIFFIEFKIYEMFVLIKQTENSTRKRSGRIENFYLSSKSLR